ncbi:MAG: IS982 family transposase [Chlamydiia bacterium]|nr:IS982 family transposase [Chlamydiia bacterium]
MNLPENDIIALFCIVDDFYKEFEVEWERRLIDNRKRKRASCLAMSEIMTIIIFFHNSGYRTFKKYYTILVKGGFCKYFPRLPSYGRFVELMKGAVCPLFCLLQGLLGSSTGISIIDSTPLPVCHNRRISSHKVFKDVAKRGKSSTGWFFGFKLHLVINDRGELVAWMLTAGNTDDRKPVKDLCRELEGILLGDRGYISSKLFKELYEIGIKLITKIKSNMKNILMHISDKFLLKKRGVIECVNQRLKETFQISHTRHRSKWNFLTNLMSGLVAYCLSSSKPSMGLSTYEERLLLEAA